MPFSGGVKGRRSTHALVCALAVLTASGLFGRPASATTGSRTASEGALSVQTDPAGAAVYVDGLFVGQTPLTLVDVADGYFPLQTGDEVIFEAIDQAGFERRAGERL